MIPLSGVDILLLVRNMFQSISGVHFIRGKQTVLLIEKKKKSILYRNMNKNWYKWEVLLTRVVKIISFLFHHVGEVNSSLQHNE